MISADARYSLAIIMLDPWTTKQICLFQYHCPLCIYGQATIEGS